MPHIITNNDLPGILNLLFYKPSTGRALSKLANTILHGPSSLSKGERELIASYVSHLNSCSFCHDSHSASATYHFNGDEKFVSGVKTDYSSAPISPKMKCLLAIAEKVQQNGKNVMPEDIAAARKQSATDDEIHDAVLIAAAFCMYNRYVDGLGTLVPEHKEDYKKMGKRMATNGYTYPNFILRKIILFFEKRKKEKK